MKNIFLIPMLLLIIFSCTQNTKKELNLKNGFYEVLATGTDSAQFAATSNTVVIPYNSIYDEQDFTWLQIDTSDLVELELEMLPAIEKDTL